MPRDTTPIADPPESSAALRALFRHIRERVPLYGDLAAEIARRRASPDAAARGIHRYVEHCSMMTDQELRYVAEKWVAEYGDRAPSQIRQWAKDQDLETDAPVFFERVATLAERMLADLQKKRASRPN